MIKDSGERKVFESGAVRDITKGKGRFDLMPLAEVGYVLADVDSCTILTNLANFLHHPSNEYLSEAIQVFVNKILTVFHLSSFLVKPLTNVSFSSIVFI